MPSPQLIAVLVVFVGVLAAFGLLKDRRRLTLNSAKKALALKPLALVGGLDAKVDPAGFRVKGEFSNGGCQVLYQCFRTEKDAAQKRETITLQVLDTDNSLEFHYVNSRPASFVNRGRNEAIAGKRRRAFADDLYAKTIAARQKGEKAA
jgi:hypothetical protein